MLDTGLEPVTSVVGGRRLDDWATEALKLEFRYNTQHHQSDKIYKDEDT